jgi:nucleotide-binding universal stress UspA family protein
VGGDDLLGPHGIIVPLDPGGGSLAKIVVGIDGSEISKQALAWAIEEGGFRKAHVLAVHAWQAPPPAADIGPSLMPSPQFDPLVALPQFEEAATQLVIGIVEEVAGESPEVEVFAEAREGPAKLVLVEAVEPDDLLVVGSRGHGGLSSILLGSVSQHCAHHAPCPVVIYRRPDDG